MFTTPRIVVLVVYFGKLLDYCDFILKSMKHSNEIDWIFITDQNVLSVSSNESVKKKTFLN